MELLTLAVLGILALLAPLASRVSGIPCVVLEICLGILFGNSVLGIIQFGGPWTTFLFDFGLIYLLFLAGLEVEARFLREYAVDSLLVGTLATIIPFAIGYAVGIAVGFSPTLTGLIFSTTSVGVVLPTARELEHLFNDDIQESNKPFSKLLIGATAVSDMLSMFMLAFMVESRDAMGETLVLMIMAAILLLPFYRALKLYSRMTTRLRELESRYYFTTRLSMVLMIVLAALAEIIGIHAVVGSFFAGVMISVLTEGSAKLSDNLLSFGYALFLPAFFLLAGAKVDLPSMLFAGDLWVLPILLAFSYLGKLGGVYAAARLRGITKRFSVAMGTLMWAKLSLVIAASEAALRMGRVSEEVYSTAVVFAMLTVLLAPVATRLLISKTAKRIASRAVSPEVV